MHARVCYSKPAVRWSAGHNWSSAFGRGVVYMCRCGVAESKMGGMGM